VPPEITTTHQNCCFLRYSAAANIDLHRWVVRVCPICSCSFADGFELVASASGGSLGSRHVPALPLPALIDCPEASMIGCGTGSYIGHSLGPLPSLENLKRIPCGLALSKNRHKLEARALVRGLVDLGGKILHRYLRSISVSVNHQLFLKTHIYFLLYSVH
jgi:hypothetical protein